MAVAFVKNHTVASNKVAGTTLGITLDTDVPAGSLIVLRILYDNASVASKPLVSSVGRPAGETAVWITSPAAPAANSTSTTAGAFASGALQCIRTGMIWPAGSYTVTLDTSTTQKAGCFQEFSGVKTTTRGLAGSAYSTTTTAASAATSITVGQIGDLTLGFIFGSNVAVAQAGDTDTTGGSWSTPVGVGSTGGSGTTNNFGIGQYKILTATGFQTLNNSAAMTAGNGALVITLIPEVPATATQAAYRFYADGTETGSTTLAAQDTAYTADISGGDINLGLRVRLQSTNTGDLFTTDRYQLQYDKNASGTWTNVTSGINVAAFASANLTDGATTTNRLTGGSGTFMAGRISEDGEADNTANWGSNNYAELLYSITLKAADLAGGDTLTFRVLRSGATTGLTYTQTPTVSVTAGAASQGITTTGIATSLAFGTSAVAAGEAARTLTGIASTLAFGTPAVTGAAGSQGISPTGIITTLTFGSSSVAAGEVTRTTTGISSTLTFGTPSVVPGAVARTTTGITTTLAFGTVSVAAGAVNITLIGVTTTVTFGAPSIVGAAGPQTITTTGITTTVAFGVITFGPVTAGRFKVWTGSAWVDKPTKVWSGTWVEKPVKVWDGNSWVLA